jgi:hypothetical protein
MLQNPPWIRDTRISSSNINTNTNTNSLLTEHHRIILHLLMDPLLATPSNH